MMVEGNCTVTVEEQEYPLSQGDILVINPYQMHYGEWQGNGLKNKYICFTLHLAKWLSFKDSALSSAAKKLLDEQYGFDAYYPKQSGGELASCLNNVYEEFFKSQNSTLGQKEAGECRLACEIYRLFSILFGKHYQEPSAASDTPRDVAFMKNVAKYLRVNYTEPISTADIAAALYMSVPQFCRVFKRHFGMSFLHYLCQYRVVRATELYRGEDLPLSDIAASVGFLDYCYFSRSFKKYIGRSPSDYFGKRVANSKKHV